MSTTTRSKPRAHKASALPFSATAAKLIEQIQADARAQLLADLSAKDAITVLHGFDQETKRVRTDGDSIEIYDAKGSTVDLYRRRHEPDNWRNSPHMAGYWHPARWYGHQALVDGSGCTWRRELAIMVCDDFGNLVEVAK